MLLINFEGREAKGLSKGRYDETFAGEDAVSEDGFYLSNRCRLLWVFTVCIVNIFEGSGGSRGGSLEPPPRHPFLNIL